MPVRLRRILIVGLSLAAVTIGGAQSLVGSSSLAAQSKASADRMPQYAKDRALMLPADYRQWVFVGSSLGLSYNERDTGHEMFHETLMEPTAYAEFVRTGTFREGTMLVLMVHGTGESVLPSRRGRFAAEVHGVEMAVKDRSRVPEGWAYYNFGGMGGVHDTAQPNPKTSCYDCHKPHAARDNVFLQYYPLLAEAARIKLPSGSEKH
jgi:cytochrome P460